MSTSVHHPGIRGNKAELADATKAGVVVNRCEIHSSVRRPSGDGETLSFRPQPPVAPVRFPVPPPFLRTTPTVPRPTGTFPELLQAGFSTAFGESSAREVLIAVSGGADSIALLHGAFDLMRQGALTQVVVAHLDHGLRGTAGAEDRAFVESTAAGLNLPCIAEAVPAEWLQSRSRGSLEEAARSARYEFLTRVAGDQKIPLVATAHQQDDQAETVLHHLIRGTGLRGVRGMPHRRELAPEMTLIRPMLHISRSLVLQYLKEEGLSFRADASNSDPRFLRNRIRHEVLPLLEDQGNAQVAQNLTRLASHAAELLDCVDALAAELLDQATLEAHSSVVRLDRSCLSRTPEPLLRHALTLLWARHQWPRQNMNTLHWQRLSVAIRSEPDHALTLPGEIQVTLRRNVVCIELPPAT